MKNRHLLITIFKSDRVNLILYLVIYLVFSLIAGLVGSVISEIRFVLMVFCLLTLYYVLFKNITINKKNSWINPYLIVNLLLKCIFIYIDEYVVSFASFLNADSYGYKDGAAAVITGKKSEYKNFVSTFIGNVVYRCWGISPGFVRFLFAFLSFLSVIVILQICDETDVDNKDKRFIALLFLFLPSSFVIASSILREGFIIFFTVCGVLYLLRWYKEQKTGTILKALICFFFSTLFHSGMIVLLIVTIFCYISYSKGEYHFTTRTIPKIVLAMIIMAVGIYYFRNLLFAKLGGGISPKNLFDRVDYLQSQGGNTLYTINVRSGLLGLDVVVNSVLRCIYLYFAPMIWDIHNISTSVIFLFDSVIYIYLFISINIKHRKVSYPEKSFVKALVWIVLLEGIVFGWGTVTAGTAMRHRLPFLLLLLLIYVISKNKSCYKEVVFLCQREKC